GEDRGTVGLFELALVWRPDDRTRLDVGVSRDVVMTQRALALGIGVRTFVAGIDWSPAQNLMLHADARQRFYSDENRAQAEAVAARWQAFANRQGHVAALVSGTQLRTRHDLDDGY